MVAHSAANFRAEDQLSSVLDDAVTVWVVLEAASELPATPETKQLMAEARGRFDALIEAAGLDEEVLREQLLKRRSARLQSAAPATIGRVVPFRPRDGVER